MKKHSPNACPLGGMGYMGFSIPELLGLKILDSLQLSQKC